MLSPTLRGYEVVDAPDNHIYGARETMWEGLGLIDWQFAPHWNSDHVESEMIDREIEYYVAHGMKYKALRDGEVMVIE